MVVIPNSIADLPISLKEIIKGLVIETLIAAEMIIGIGIGSLKNVVEKLYC